MLKRVFDLFVECETKGCLRDSFHDGRRRAFVERTKTLSLDDVFCHVHDLGLDWWLVIGLQSVDLHNRRY